jgi:hypothetical protein
MTTPDDELLERLGRALEPEDRAPSADRVRKLRAYAAGRPARRSGLIRALAAAAMLLVFAGGVLLGASPPDAVRDLAHDVGLPVESSTLVDTRDALYDLGVAISERDRAAARSADQRMLDLVDRLDAEEKAKIVPVAHEVHERALELIEGASDDPLTCPPVCDGTAS